MPTGAAAGLDGLLGWKTCPAQLAASPCSWVSATAAYAVNWPRAGPQPRRRFEAPDAACPRNAIRRRLRAVLADVGPLPAMALRRKRTAPPQRPGSAGRTVALETLPSGEKPAGCSTRQRLGALQRVPPRFSMPVFWDLSTFARPGDRRTKLERRNRLERRPL